MNPEAGFYNGYGARMGELRALAGRLTARGSARLRLECAYLRRLERLVRAVQRLDGDDEAARLIRDGRAMESCARQALAEGGQRLPACGGRPRVEILMSALCAGGESRLTRESLLEALREFDEIQPLAMAELWAVPAAARIALARALADTAASIAADARRRAAAERWVRHPALYPMRPDAAFVERALKRTAEDARPQARRRLESSLSRRRITPERAIRRAHAARALNQLRLDNLLAGKRLLDELDWQACFRALSRVDRELRADPGGIYGRMDDDSRAAVRDQTSAIARRLGMTELAVARHAVDAARTRTGREGTVCWWLYDDAGRSALLERVGRERSRLPRIVPDPRGKLTCAGLIGLSSFAFAILALCAGTPWLWPACIPLAWTAGCVLAGRVCPKFAPPAKLLKLELEAVPEDCRTLVVMPVLLSAEARADETCAQLEALGCLETDENIEYLLLGDFADAPRAQMPSDAAILDRARKGIAALNARAERQKYAYLHRPRTLLQADGVWMGRDRKRGALAALNRLLLGEACAEAAFSAEGAACARLRGRFAFVITLDADTRLLPGAVREMIGAMAHPLNRPQSGRGHAVLQPRMEARPSACVNEFVRLFAGTGGVDAYPVSVSNLWQDLTGTGIYAGKGIYDVAAFQHRLEDALPEGRVLSHDLIEGAVAGAGFLGDVTMYDACPASLSGTLRRRHRWMRGDWQLLPLFFSGKPLPGGGRLSFADRLRMAGNLLRSLRAPALLALLTASVWTGSSGMLLAALASAYLEPLLEPFGGDTLRWRRATARLAMLPASAWCAVDATLRTLWRLFVSGRHLMDWVTAADTEGGGSCGGYETRVPFRTAALLMLPGLLRQGWTLAALALAALFWIGPGWIRDMERTPVEPRQPLSDEDRRLFLTLARQTWAFFEAQVPAGCAMPPDNVQIDPPAGAVRRTSPTNIGLYMAGCLAASRLGFIDRSELLRRLCDTVDALEGAEKWRGHLYNWIDIDDLTALRPRYVSSVDSGNLAASLMLCAGAPELAGDAALSGRMRALASEMDFKALYDPRRELFAIGMDVDNGRLSRSHYDLLASESRILSFTAMMLGQVPQRHWRKLGRPCAAAEGGAALVSWSGTMFEYLMPELLMPAPGPTLLGRSVREALRAQRLQGARLDRPWGVSESGCYAFDAALNYQYRAFGLPALALSGEAVEGVVAPYASALAAVIDPGEAARNLRRMRALGWAGEWGLYEAADYLRPGPKGEPTVVKSHMAHHQGMILCALCNALTDDSLSGDFMEMPQARALSLLLEEKPFCGHVLRRANASRQRCVETVMEARASWPARPELRLAETHLLYGGGATSLVTGDGAIHYATGGVSATRFSGDLLNRTDTACVHLRNADTGAAALLNGSAAFEPGRVRFAARIDRVDARMDVCISAEDGTLIKLVELYNAGNCTERVDVTDVVPVALAKETDWRGHAAFSSLFVQSSRPEPCALRFSRRARYVGETLPILLHRASGAGEVGFETDYERLVGRLGSTGWAGGIAPELTGTLGAVLNPVSALRLRTTLRPGERVRLCFAMALLSEGEDEAAWHERYSSVQAADRALRLAAARARAMLGFIGLRGESHRLIQRMAALLFDGRLAAQAKAERRPEPGAGRETLWSMGLSGDRPILLARVDAPEQAETARAILRACEFYRAMGVETDLVFIDDGGDGYARPIRDALTAMIAAATLREGGAAVLDGARLTPAQREALRRAAALCFRGGRDFEAQAREILSVLEVPERAAPRRLDTGASTLKPLARARDNGFGGFLPDGSYAIDVLPDRLPPAPWSNVLADDRFGMLITERGGGFCWHDNSRSGRLTAFGNDALREGWGWMLYLSHPGRNERLRLLPGDVPQLPFRAVFDPASVRFLFETRRLSGEVCFCLRRDVPEAVIDVRLENRALPGEDYLLTGFVDWLMGVDASDGAYLNCWQEGGACFATGTGSGVGYLASTDAGARSGPGRAAFLGRGGAMQPEGLNLPSREGGCALEIPLRLRRGKACAARLALGWAEDIDAARERVRALRGDDEPVLERACEAWREIRDGLIIETPDADLDRFANGFLPHQIRSCRMLARTGLYQPGGAYGFRDQLQDALALLPFEPRRVRAHLLRCAARQFEAGDVIHWWHEPFLGVRTRICDDMLFLPFVAAAYVRTTGDGAVLEETIPFLEDAQIPEGAEDVYREMRQSDVSDTLHGHCMRAFRRAARTGAHGLALMGAGDWNDGMDRVGARGRGESVWLSEFLAVCAEAYAAVIRAPGDILWLREVARQMRGAVEKSGWDGEWYLRAYDDDGAALGSAANAECRIDAISQAWAVLAGLDATRCRSAMDAAWRLLADEEHGLIRLLTPPFDGAGPEPGYIRGYPPGVRENGAQYTHGALWLLLALIRMGDGDRVRAALGMLLPYNHGDTREKALRYRLEPYVMAADVYAGDHAGRGGWSWYTGSAAWMHICLLELLGYERRGDRVRLGAMLGDWPRAGVRVRFGGSSYRLICERDAQAVTLDGRAVEGEFIQMVDDGMAHTACFPPRRTDK